MVFTLNNDLPNDTSKNGRPPFIPRVRRVAMLSVHTCPLAVLGGKKTGGMNVYVRDLSHELGRLRILVDVFTRSQDDCQPRIKHDLGYGARVIHVPAGPEKPIAIAEVGNYLDEFTEGVLRFAAAEEIHYDLIHSHYWLSGLVAEKLRRAWGEHIPIIQMFHTLGHVKNRIALDAADMAPQSRIDGESDVINIADRIVVATPAEQAQLLWLYGADLGKTVVIPPGVDLERFRPLDKAEAKSRIGIPPHHQTIIFAGRIERLKGIETLLEAIALLQDRYPQLLENVCVGVIGGDPWTDTPDAEIARLQELRAQLGIHETVTFLGAKDQDALPNYYAAADMVVMPSHYESFGLVALEAMAMGVPVIASEVGGLAFLVRDGETGYHVPSRDPEALAEKILVLLTDRACLERLGRQAHRYAQQYDWRIIAQHILVLYEEVLAPPGPQGTAAFTLTGAHFAM